MLFFENLFNLYVEMSFYIVIGIFFTGLLHAFVKREWIINRIGKKSIGSVIKASIIGVPLPLCSCGVVPTAIYLKKNGASKGAVTSFLTSTPQTGVDSLIATYGMMGPFFAVFRAVAAFISGVITGVVTDTVVKDDKFDESVEVSSCCTAGLTESSCGCSSKVEESTCGCSSKAEESTCGCSAKVEESSCGCSEKVEESSCGCSSQSESSGCGCGSAENTPKNISLLAKFKSVFTYGFGSFLDEISINFVVGLLIATLISTLIPQDLLSSVSIPIVSMLIMLVIGIPMYVCSTASIPIAVSLIMKGISPGAAFVFLFAGPVTNVASLTILAKTLGKKTLIVYIASVSVCAIAFGLAMDFIISVFNVSDFGEMVHGAHGGHHSWFMLTISGLFLILVSISVFKNIRKKLFTK